MLKIIGTPSGPHHGVSPIFPIIDSSAMSSPPSSTPRGSVLEKSNMDRKCNPSPFTFVPQEANPISSPVQCARQMDKFMAEMTPRLRQALVMAAAERSPWRKRGPKRNQLMQEMKRILKILKQRRSEKAFEERLKEIFSKPSASPRALRLQKEKEERLKQTIGTKMAARRAAYVTSPGPVLRMSFNATGNPVISSSK